MHIIHEDLVRAHISARMEEARAERRAQVLARAQRAAKRAGRKPLKARLLLPRPPDATRHRDAPS